jgi:hypothetical protein
MADELRNLKRALRRLRRFNLVLMIYILVISLGILIYVTNI